MNERYLVHFRETNRGDFKANTFDWEIPNSIAGAAHIVNCITEEMSPDCLEFEVIELSQDTGRWTDVTSKVMRFIEDEQIRDLTEALEDLVHERQERHKSNFV